RPRRGQCADARARRSRAVGGARSASRARSTGALAPGGEPALDRSPLHAFVRLTASILMMDMRHPRLVVAAGALVLVGGALWAGLRSHAGAHGYETAVVDRG